MLQNAFSLAKIGADTAENARHFAENDGEEAAARRLKPKRTVTPDHGPPTHLQTLLHV